jgi:hypothetical protein
MLTTPIVRRWFQPAAYRVVRSAFHTRRIPRIVDLSFDRAITDCSSSLANEFKSRPNNVKLLQRSATEPVPPEELEMD